MVQDVLGKLCALFDSGAAKYRVVHHPACERSSQSVSEVRGTELGQGGVKQYVLAVLPADCQADLGKLATALGGRRAGLCSAEEVMDLTGCIFGAVPPVSFHEKLMGIADPTLFTRYKELAFNAGSRDTSIIIDTQDFHRIVHPREIDFLKK